MRTRYLLGLSLVAALSGWASVAAQNPASPSQNTVDFARDIQPILQATCYECHGPQKTKAHLRLDSRAGIIKGGESGAIVVPGNSEQSLIVRRVLGLDGEDRMPKDGDPLPPAQIALIRAWIDQGASWPDTASRRRVRAAPRRNETGRTGPIAGRPVRHCPPCRRTRVGAHADRSIRPGAAGEGRPGAVAEASMETLVRRVSLDLIGLPPTPRRSTPSSPSRTRRQGRRVAALVDRLLASPHYGERWARPWLDLARYADSHGYEKDSRA